jgi:hypothetical protein
VVGYGWHKATVPISSFRFPAGRTGFDFARLYSDEIPGKQSLDGPPRANRDPFKFGKSCFYPLTSAPAALRIYGHFCFIPRMTNMFERIGLHRSIPINLARRVKIVD